jgi:hypothetical protein
MLSRRHRDMKKTCWCHISRRTAAMASLKVQCRFGYQAAVAGTSPEGNEREQAQQRRGGAYDREAGPLTLRFDTEMGMNFLKGNLPRQRETNHWRILTGAASRSVQRKAWGGSWPMGSRTSSHRMGTGGEPPRYQTAVPVAIATTRVQAR